MLGYHIIVSPDDNDTLLVTCPAFPEVTTFGESLAEARHHAVEAIEEAIAARIATNEPVPRPQRRLAGRRVTHRRKTTNHWVSMHLLSAFKTLLYIEMRESKTSRAELARRLGWGREQVDRLFRLDHHSRFDQIEQAFHALRRTFDIEVRECEHVRECA